MTTEETTNINTAPVIASIDIGTNSFHMVIAAVNNRSMLDIISRDKEVVRLGSSGADMKYLQPDAIERGIRTLKNFVSIARSSNADIRAVATSAVREALNQEDFLLKAKIETDVNIEVVSGTEEGRLIYLGAIHALPIISKQTLVIDIGGGSTETIIAKDGTIKYVHSEKLGSIRLTRRFFNGDRIAQSQVDECRDYIKCEWAPILNKVKSIGFECVIGTSGTITNIVAMAVLATKQIVPDVLNGVTVPANDVLRTIEQILKCSTTKEIAAIPGIDPDRADIITAGAIILEQAIVNLNIEKITLSSYALREGILFDTLEKQKAISEYHHLTYLRYETIYNLCKKFSVDMKHAEHVKDISMAIFDALQPLHKLNYTERELLESAALLHDIGYHISHDQHHRHSYYIINQSVMQGFTNTEAEILANIARYHRKSHPKKKHENFIRLDEDKQQIVWLLASILRIAEGIDRRQLQLVKSVRAEFNPVDINIYLVPKDKDVSPDIELWGANRRKLMMEEAYNRKVYFYITDREL